jgi:nucleotide-binding universal stress UspA family protein
MPLRNVLLATDLDLRTDRAMDRAAALAMEWNTRLVIAHAIEETPERWARAHTRDPRAAATLRIREDLREPVPADLEIVVERADAVRLILDTIKRLDCQLVVTGVGRDTGFGRVSAGATVDALARLSPVPLLAVRTRANRPYRNVYVSTDFSEPSRDALITATEVFPSAHITLFHAFHVAYEGFIDDRGAARDAEALHAEHKAREFLAETDLGNRLIPVRVEHGPPAWALRELALTGGVDLVVVGTRGRGVIGQLLLGSVARSIVANVPVDVLVGSNRAMEGS